MSEPKWETVNRDHNRSPSTERLRIPEGWIYRTWSHNFDEDGNTEAMAMVFVPSKHYEGMSPPR